MECVYEVGCDMDEMKRMAGREERIIIYFSVSNDQNHKYKSLIRK